MKHSRLYRLKHSPLARDLSPDDLKKLAQMPEDETFMEIAALRVTAANAMELVDTCTGEKDRIRAINSCVKALNAASNAIFKAHYLSSDAPVLNELWAAIEKANRLNGLDDTV
jgi:hypothetical protein